MTEVANTGPGSDVQAYDENYGSVGLEDVEASDLVLPRISINHDDMVYENSMTKEQFAGLTCIFLGLVKQRVMWPAKLDDGDKPVCKSTDNSHGFPRFGDGIPKTKQFPWGASNFEPSNLREVNLEPGEDAAYPNGWSSNGYGVLDCATCIFAKWGKDEDGKSTPPPCSEQHTYPILYLTQTTDPDTGETTDFWQPAIFTVQRSAIKNSRNFINTFAQSKTPFFTQYVTLGLEHASRGGNEFAIPTFKKSGQSDRTYWPDYANQLRSVRDYLRQGPRPQDDGDVPDQPQDNTNTAPTPEPTPAPAPEPAPPAPSPTPTPTPPQAGPPAPPAPPAPPKAATPPRPAAPPAPPAPPAAPAPPQSATPAAPEPPDPSGLPF